jgi:hypothetical protein
VEFLEFGAQGDEQLPVGTKSVSSIARWTRFVITFSCFASGAATGIGEKTGHCSARKPPLGTPVERCRKKAATGELR